MNRPVEAALGPNCAAPGCDRPRGTRRLCDAHRKRAYRGASLLPPIDPTHGRIPGRLCTQGCGRKRNVRGGICAACKSAFYRRKRKLVAATVRSP
jgi:hypothetical protein